MNLRNPTVLTVEGCQNIYLGIKVKLDLAKAFGKSAGFGVGLIFLPPVFLAMLAFGDAQYVSQQ